MRLPKTRFRQYSEEKMPPDLLIRRHISQVFHGWQILLSCCISMSFEAQYCHVRQLLLRKPFINERPDSRMNDIIVVFKEADVHGVKGADMGIGVDHGPGACGAVPSELAH